MAKKSDVAAQRLRACQALMAQVHAITADEGINPSTLHAIKLKLVALAKRKDLFPAADFAMPVAQGRNYPLLVEEGDGLGLYLNVALPGKEAAPHDHGIWCATAARISLNNAASQLDAAAAASTSASSGALSRSIRAAVNASRFGKY